MDVKLLAALMRSQLTTSLFSDNSSTEGIDGGELTTLLSQVLAQSAGQTSGKTTDSESNTFESLTMKLPYSLRSPEMRSNPLGRMNNPTEFDQLIEQTADKHGVDPALVRAVVRQEFG